MSAVSNRPLCQIVLGVKLSFLPSWCQIVPLPFLVSNCPRYQIILSPKGTILMLDLFERRRRKKAYVPDFIRGIKERAICLREPSFLPSSLNCFPFFYMYVYNLSFVPSFVFCLGYWGKGKRSPKAHRNVVECFYRRVLSVKISTKLKLQNLDETSVSESMHCIGE